MKSYLGSYFKDAEKKAKKMHRGADASWPEYVASTQSRVRRVVVTEHRAMQDAKIGSGVENLYMDQVAQDVAHSQVSKSRRGKLPRKISPVKVLAWGGWSVAMAGFAGSLLFNFPLAIGSFVLRVIPGETRVGTIAPESVQTEQLKPGQSLDVDLFLKDVAGKNVRGANVAIQYNPQTLELNEITTGDGLFSEVLEAEYSQENGTAKVSLQDPKNAAGEKNKLARLKFTVRSYVGSAEVRVVPTTVVFVDSAQAAVPKKMLSLALNITQGEILPVSVPLIAKTNAVTIDGNLDDWRDVVSYNAADFDQSGTIVGERNLREGQITSDSDAGGVLQVAYDETNVYLSFFAADDEFLEGDKVGIKFGTKVFDIPLTQATKAFKKDALEAKVAEIDLGYILEVKIPRESLPADLTQPFNFEVHDVDSQDAARLMLSFPEDSMTKL